ncbi:MAG: hypothetical protein ACREM8_10865, partial [Vulcanimicrobiaceae bacterium]
TSAPTASGNGNAASDERRRFERRGGRSAIETLVRADDGRSLDEQDESVFGPKRTGVIRICVPIDVRAVAETACGAFALVTPLRIDQLVTLAVCEALGPRAPEAKRTRSLRTTLAGLVVGDFVVEIDGRRHDRLDDVVACSNVVTVRFFVTPQRRRIPARESSQNR